jgi:hypothetical protein
MVFSSQVGGSAPVVSHSCLAWSAHWFCACVIEAIGVILPPKMVSRTRAVTSITTAATMITRVVDMPFRAIFN